MDAGGQEYPAALAMRPVEKIKIIKNLIRPALINQKLIIYKINRKMARTNWILDILKIP